MKPNLTEKENDVYRYICEATELNGYSPSVRDIQEALGIKSTATVHSYLNKLESKGYIQKAQGKSRTLRVETAPSFPTIHHVRFLHVFSIMIPSPSGNYKHTV